MGFWLELALQSAGPVLELACGTGRVALPLAAAGVAVVGLDHDQEMLAALRSRGGGSGCGKRSVPVIAADMRRFSLAAEFSLVLVAYNSLQLLADPPGMAACVSCARHHLAPGGVFAAEVTDFQAGASGGAIGEEVLADVGGIRLSGSLDHDLARRTSRYRRSFTGEGWTFRDEVVLRSLERRELIDVLAAGGLEPVTWWREGPTLRVVAAPIR